MKFQLLIILVFVLGTLKAQVCNYPTDSIPEEWLGKDDLVDKVIENKGKYRLQIILSAICEDSFNTVSYSDNQYYYPASLVKLPTVLVALGKMKREGIVLDDRIVLKDLAINGNKSFIQKTRNGISFRELIEKTLVISDNDYYNVLYHFVTPRELNSQLNDKKFGDVLVYRCFNGCSKEEQLITAGYSIFNTKDSLISHSEGDKMDWTQISEFFSYDEDKRIGSRHISKGKLYTDPYDFNDNLEFPIESLHRMMISFIEDSTGQNWDIGQNNREFVLQKLKQFPDDIGEEKYKRNDFKIIAFGNSKLNNDRFTTYSKIGYSYGFITECAFVQDALTGKDFYLTVSMYVNKNETINDGQYQYSSVATPFMGSLTHIIADQLIDK